MAKNDEAARIARANELRNRIAGLSSGQLQPEDSKDEAKSTGKSVKQPAEDDTPACKNPREFIERRMRELDRKKR